MISLDKEYIVLDEQSADGWREKPKGIVFHFREGASIYISKKMAERITATFHFLYDDDEGA